MAFTGTATVEKVSDRIFRITGLSLAGDASGTIGFTDKTVAANVSLEAPTWQPFGNAEGDTVSLQAAIECTLNRVEGDGSGVVIPISVVKTGTDHGDFVATFHNDSVEDISPELEIYVAFH